MKQKNLPQIDKKQKNYQLNKNHKQIESRNIKEVVIAHKVKEMMKLI